MVRIVFSPNFLSAVYIKIYSVLFCRFLAKVYIYIAYTCLQNTKGLIFHHLYQFPLSIMETGFGKMCNFFHFLSIYKDLSSTVFIYRILVKFYLYIAYTLGFIFYDSS